MSHKTPPHPHQLNVLVAAGGTGGHLSPALVLADNLRRRKHLVQFATSKNGRDEPFVRDRGYVAHTFSVTGIPRRGVAGQLRALVRAALAVFRCMAIIGRIKPDVVLCGGGFVCAPMAVAARLRGVPVIATEVDSHLGLANQVAARCAKRLCCAFPLRSFRLKQEVTGRPIAPEFFQTSRDQARMKYGIDSDTPVVVIVGGSGGALKLNESAFDAFGSRELTIDGTVATILHVTGKRDYSLILDRWNTTGHGNKSAYKLIEFETDMPSLLASADIVVSRSGGTIFEIAAVGRPTILVPFPHSTGDHQRTNARYFERKGAAVYLDDNDCDAQSLRNEVDKLLADSAKQLSMSKAISKLGTQAASERICDIVERAVKQIDEPEIVDESSDFTGRTFHMMGVGGAGVSAIAQLAAAWGAEVTGCDQAPSSYSKLVEKVGVPVAIGHNAKHVVAGSELIISSAIPRDHPELLRAQELGVPHLLRGELLGEMTRKRRTIVVAGAHGKSTTTAMIVHIAHANGVDCSAMVGATVPSLGNSNVHVGTSEWFVVEGDESDRTLLHLDADVAVITNIERDHHHTFDSDDEVFELFEKWIRSQKQDSKLIIGKGVGTDRLFATFVDIARDTSEYDNLRGLVTQTITIPGKHNVENAVCAIDAVSEMGISQADALEALKSFRAIGRRFDVVANIGDIAIVDDYAHHPTEVAATVSAARDFQQQRGEGRVVVVFQPHLYSRTEALHREFGEALSAADEVVLLPIYGAREKPIPGVDSALIAQFISGPNVSVAEIDPATGDVSTIVGLINDGDCVLTMGAGSITELAPRLAAALADDSGNNGSPAIAPTAILPTWIERDVPLSRFTTIGTGGNASLMARVGTPAELAEAMQFARANDLPIAVVGLGSNSLIADDGFHGLAIRLVDDLARIDIDAETGRVVCGGGASLAAVVRLCRDAGLSGFEFGCAIPGTIGGAVKMNAGAYGGEMVDVLSRVLLVSSAGEKLVRPSELEMTYRHTNIGWDTVVAEATMLLTHDEPEAIKVRVKEMQQKRSDSQPRAARSFGSVFRNPRDDNGNPAELGAGALIERAGLKGHTIGGACISPKHGNFIENLGDARTADVLALIEAARQAVHEATGVTLVTEVHLLDVDGYRPLHVDVGAGA